MTYTAITAKAFRSKAGSLAKKLAAEFALIGAEYNSEVVTLQAPLDLSGSAATSIVFAADRAYTITAANLCYAEASSADAGVNITVGKLIVGTDDPDYFVAAVATETSQEAGYRKALTLAQIAIVEGDIVTITSAGGKTGTGAVILQLELTRA